jgi:hypothetical protein
VFSDERAALTSKGHDMLWTIVLIVLIVLVVGALFGRGRLSR